MKNNLNISTKDAADRPQSAVALLEKSVQQSNGVIPKNKRPAAKEYFKEMTGSKESLVVFIQEHLAPAVLGRAKHNVGGAYYGAIAKNSRETAVEVVSNALCNYKAFRKKLETYSISSEELSRLLGVEVNYKQSKKAKYKNASTAREAKVLDILKANLITYIPDGEKLELIARSIYTELNPIINKTK